MWGRTVGTGNTTGGCLLLGRIPRGLGALGSPWEPLGAAVLWQSRARDAPGLCSWVSGRVPVSIPCSRCHQAPLQSDNNPPPTSPWQSHSQIFSFPAALPFTGTGAVGPGCVFLGDLALERGFGETSLPPHGSFHPGARFGLLHSRALEEDLSSLRCHGRGAEGKRSPGVIQPIPPTPRLPPDGHFLPLEFVCCPGCLFDAPRCLFQHLEEAKG